MNTKKVYLGLVAILMAATAAFAFNAPVKKAPANLAIEWFQYNGGGVSNPNNYSELPGAPSCMFGSTLCAIQAPENGSSGKPTQAGVDNPIAFRNHL